MMGNVMTETTKYKTIFIIALFLLLIFAVLTGCQSQDSKITPEQIDKMDGRIEGNENQIAVHTEKISKVENVQQEIQDGNSNSGGEGDDHIESESKHVENSIWLFIAFGAMLFGAMFLFLYFWRGFPIIGRKKV